MAQAEREHQGEGRGRNRRDEPEGPENFWHGEREEREVEDWRFKVTLIRRDAHGREREHQRVDSMVTSLSWVEAKAATTATITLQNPDDHDNFRVDEGHQAMVEVDKAGGQANWKELWTLRVRDPSDTTEGVLTLQMEDELAWMQRSKDDWLYKKGKEAGPHKKRKGWLCHQVARDVCERYGVPLGRLAKGKHRIENLSMDNTSPLAVIVEAYKREREETGEKFIVRIRRGNLEVVKLRRSKYLLLASGIFLTATYNRTLSEDFATTLTVTGSYKRKKGDQKKIEVRVRSPKAIRQRFGEVHQTFELEDPVGTTMRARKRGKRELARRQKPTRDLSFTLPGDPHLRRGDALKIKLAQFDLNQIVYLKSVAHNASPSTYTCDCIANFADPFKDEEGDKIRDKRCKEAREHGRREPDFCDENADVFAPAGSGRRRNRGDRR